MNAFAKALEEGRFYVGNVCDDCTVTHENSDGSGNSRDWDGARYSRTCAEYDLSLGHPHDLPQWFTDCSHIGERCPDDADCDCERTEFSTSECDLCGTNLHGARHHYVFIKRSDLRN
jgi:hypothetical protein